MRWGNPLVYLTDTYEYTIPFGEKESAIPPRCFPGTRHLLCVKKARAYEIGAYRNLALNVNDQHGNEVCYPGLLPMWKQGESPFLRR